MFLDVRGCANEALQRSAVRVKQEKIELQKTQEQRKQAVLTLPSQWKILHAGMEGTYYRDDKWDVFRTYFKDNPKIQLPELEPLQVRLFLGMLQSHHQEKAFALITKHTMGKADDK